VHRHNQLANRTARGHDGDMDNLQTQREIVLGDIRLTQDKTGDLLAHHAAMSKPVVLNTEQLRRWIMRQLREMLA
jgi:hypothetical protein